MGKLTADLIGSDDHPKNRGGHHGCSSRQNYDKDALDVHHGRFWAERTEAKQRILCLGSVTSACHYPAGGGTSSGSLSHSKKPRTCRMRSASSVARCIRLVQSPLSKNSCALLARSESIFVRASKISLSRGMKRPAFQEGELQHLSDRLRHEHICRRRISLDDIHCVFQLRCSRVSCKREFLWSQRWRRTNQGNCSLPKLLDHRIGRQNNSPRCHHVRRYGARLPFILDKVFLNNPGRVHGTDK